MPSRLARHWTLDPEVVFLNHGSFGACPRVVLETQQRIRDEIERQPLRFFVRNLWDRLDDARERLARFLGADPLGLAPVPNATTGVNAVLRSLHLAPGDELLVTDHAYAACRNALDFVAARAGAKTVVVRLPVPGATAELIERLLLEAVGPRTRLALLDHVTSPTGLVLPIRNLVRELDELGVDTLVDGAHAPGMLPLDLSGLGSAYYTGNCHKWLCAPKGAGFLYVREDRREETRPVTISHGASARRPGRSRFHEEFDWVGTDDPSAFLSVPEALDTIGSMLPGGWDAVRRHNRDLALKARAKLSVALGVEPPCREEMIGALVSLPLPDGPAGPERSAFAVDPLQDRLLAEHSIEVPVMTWPEPPRRWLRVSAQLYNDESDYDRLVDALRRTLAPS